MVVTVTKITRKLCYRKDCRAMRLIYNEKATKYAVGNELYFSGSTSASVKNAVAQTARSTKVRLHQAQLTVQSVD